jgi:hypothetical protein
MKTVLPPIAAGILIVGLWQIFISPGVSAQRSEAPNTAQESPLACNRMALTAAQRKRHFEVLGPALRARKKSVHELANGFEFELPADPATLQLAAEWAGGERDCCPFFGINLRLDPEGGPLWLSLTGRPGVKLYRGRRRGVAQALSTTTNPIGVQPEPEERT